MPAAVPTSHCRRPTADSQAFADDDIWWRATERRDTGDSLSGPRGRVRTARRPVADETLTTSSNAPADSNRAEPAPVSTYNLIVTVLLSV